MTTKKRIALYCHTSLLSGYLRSALFNCLGENETLQCPSVVRLKSGLNAVVWELKRFSVYVVHPTESSLEEIPWFVDFFLLAMEALPSGAWRESLNPSTQIFHVLPPCWAQLNLKRYPRTSLKQIIHVHWVRQLHEVIRILGTDNAPPTLAALDEMVAEVTREAMIPDLAALLRLRDLELQELLQGLNRQDLMRAFQDPAWEPLKSRVMTSLAKEMVRNLEDEWGYVKPNLEATARAQRILQSLAMELEELGRLRLRWDDSTVWDTTENVDEGGKP